MTGLSITVSTTIITVIISLTIAAMIKLMAVIIGKFSRPEHLPIGTQAGCLATADTFEAKPTAEVVPATAARANANASITTPLPGLIVSIDKKVGDRVKTGETVMIIESMKMETTLTAPVDGMISSVLVTLQQQVPTGMVVAVVN